MIKPIPPRPTPGDFGAFPGEIDNTTALQAWLDYGGELSLDRNYYTGRALWYHGKTFIKGIHPYLTGIYSLPSLPLDHQLLVNKDFSLDIKKIAFVRLENIGLGGPLMTTEQDRQNTCLNFIGVEFLEVSNLLVRDWRKMCIGLNNVSDFSFEKVEVERYGSLLPVPQPGACLFEGGVAFWISWNCARGTLRDIWVHNGEWTALDVSGYKLTMDDWLIENVKEAGVFSGPTSSTFNNFKIFDVHEKDCSGHPFETGGFDNQITNCIIDRCDRNGIILTTPNNFIVRGNIIRNTNNLPTTLEAGAITVRTVGDTYKTQNLQITGNVLVPDEKKKSPYAIAMNNQADFPETKKFQNCDLRGNITGADGEWGKKVIKFDSKDQGDCCYV
jgi:hypothetical protein